MTLGPQEMATHSTCLRRGRCLGQWPRAADGEWWTAVPAGSAGDTSLGTSEQVARGTEAQRKQVAGAGGTGGGEVSVRKRGRPWAWASLPHCRWNRGACQHRRRSREQMGEVNGSRAPPRKAVMPGGPPHPGSQQAAGKWHSHVAPECRPSAADQPASCGRPVCRRRRGEKGASDSAAGGNARASGNLKALRAPPCASLSGGKC